MTDERDEERPPGSVSAGGVKNSDKSLEWSDHDDAEYQRIAAEMNDDVKAQHDLFVFAVGGTGLLAALVPLAAEAWANRTTSGFLAAACLAPLVLSIPTSLMILNRARTRNRKSAHVMIALDYKRLKKYGVTETTELSTVRTLSCLPWETALQILDRTNELTNRRVHLAPALYNVAGVFFVIESLFAAAATTIGSGVLSGSSPHLMSWVAAVGGSVVGAIAYRISILVKLCGRWSIQGHVAMWLLSRPRSFRRPRYVTTWLREFDPDWETRFAPVMKVGGLLEDGERTRSRGGRKQGLESAASRDLSTRLLAKFRALRDRIRR